MMKELSMIKVVEQLLIENDAPLALTDIFKEVAEIKGFSETDYETLNQLYLDIVTSASFVYMGQGLWDLKERNLEYWDKDGTDFISESDAGDPSILEGYKEVSFAHVAHEKVESIIGLNRTEEDDDLDYDDYEADLLDDLEDEDLDFDELDEEEKQALIEEKQYMAGDLDLASIDDDDFDLDLGDIDEDDYDEEEYHEIMDEYEDMY
ncbi:MAG: DNA-directed RNA polymerase subunit delta [Acholeplasmataceae bacterium]